MAPQNAVAFVITAGGALAVVQGIGLLGRALRKPGRFVRKAMHICG
jgi:hypothetical protein